MPKCMRGMVFVAGGLLAAGCADTPVQPSDEAAAPEASARQGGDPVVPGEVVVRVRAGVDMVTLTQGLGLFLSQETAGAAFQVLRGTPGTEQAVAASLVAGGQVEWAEPNYLRQPTTVNPNLWAFYNPGGLNMKFTIGSSSGQYIPSSYASLADADEDNVQGYAAGGADVVIGSIDTGVDFSHPELAGRLIPGRDWYSNDNDPSDTEGHGTHTTGTMAGNTVGVAGVSGAAAHVRVYVQRVCGKRGCPSAAIASAIRAAADYPGLVAMNLSLGGSSESQAEKDAITYAVTTRGVLVIASAGNSGSGTVSCPACDPNAISVAASNWKDAKTSYSQYGSGLDIFAPGGECYSNTTPEGCIYSSYKGGGYAWLQGTSMAAPQVTGTAGIVASVRGLRGTLLRDQILNSADNLSGLAGYGTGKRLNSYRAVTNAILPLPQ